MLLNKEKLKSRTKRLGVYFARVVLCLYTLSVLVLGAADFYIPDTVSVSQTSAGVAVGINDGEYVSAKLFGHIPVKNVKVKKIQNVKLIPCGNVFGVKFFTKGVLVINLSEIQTKDGFASPAKKAGLKVGDVITSVDGVAVNTVEELSKCVMQSKGDPMEICFNREQNPHTCTLKASLSLSDKQYKTGIWVRDSTAGIGTMTFYNPQNGTFAGLGHGICDVDTGTLMPLLRGTVVDVEVTDILKGRKGFPGELKGSFGVQKRGTLTQNSPYGVFGVMDSRPKCAMDNPIEVAFSHQVKEGKAVIYTQLDANSGIKNYSVNITNIDPNNASGKNFVVEITDKELLDKTGGIVQGMSGSPVVQDGKLVGAITHVLVNDPQKGYGLFAENMLANMPLLMQ